MVDREQWMLSSILLMPDTFYILLYRFTNSIKTLFVFFLLLDLGAIEIISDFRWLVIHDVILIRALLRIVCTRSIFGFPPIR